MADCLAQNLRYMRKMARMSRREEARQLGVTATTVANWETGTARPSEKHMKDIGTLYDTEIGENGLTVYGRDRLTSDADRVLHRRLRMGMSVRDLSICADIPESTVYRIERSGLGRMYAPVIRSLAEALGTTAEWLTAGSGPEETQNLTEK